ncbi:MAG: rod shape-determining protein MreC [Ruminococcaceae bacterium]|nr:rod shape-determining protein MreC [Oscillospiraceae bacterium]
MEKRRKLPIVMLIITIVIFVLMGISFALPANSSSGNILGTVLSPVQKFFYGIGNGIGGFFDFIGDMNNFQHENLELKDQVNELSKQVRELESYKDENERLRSLLELKSNSQEQDMVGCEVIAKDPGNWFYTFTVDKGSNDGIKVDDAVVSGEGLVGHVKEVGHNWAKVLTIIDADSSVGAAINRSQNLAIVDGDLSLADSDRCIMSFITNDSSSVVVGDKVVTSGLGGVYPEGILIGTVSEIKSDSMGYSQYAIIETAVDFERIREVMIIRSNR